MCLLYTIKLKWQECFDYLILTEDLIDSEFLIEKYTISKVFLL